MEHSFMGINILFRKGDIRKIIESNQTGTISTINANIIVNAYQNNEYKDILKNNVFNICDGSLLVTIINLLNRTRFSSYPGPDFFIDRIIEKKYKHAFIGSSKEVLKGLQKKMIAIDGNIKNSLFYELPFKNVNEFKYSKIAKKVNQENPDFIWVSLGAPKQEIFAHNLQKHIEKGFIVSVGAAFDFYSGLGHINRSPKILRHLKLEWLYRVFKQPTKTLKRLKAELFYMPIIILREILKKIK